MIANAQEYQISRQAAARLAHDLARVYEQEERDPLPWAAVRSGLFAQLAEVEGQLAAYDAQRLRVGAGRAPASV